ncbi:hypothetical protein [Leptospira kanakyensis]|uniref:hypothetical protein n=1 Tax=Leptospira kanakyensis TaxID=2484968 RepID=UPI00223CA725|nr:hypothetical protein [Leptospira kanakyensis]MCW7471434.1 hypothetical protein [Leptospira kanakyensis]
MNVFFYFVFLCIFAIGLDAKDERITKNENWFLYQFRLPESAPEDFGEWESLLVPSPSDYELPKNLPVGESLTSEGGKINFSSKSNFIWELADGSVFTQRDGSWEWKNNTHTVRSVTSSHALWQSLHSIQFPDGTIVTKHKIPKSNTNQYTYQKKNKEGQFLFFDIVHPKEWGTERTVVGVFDITYSPIWSLVVESLRETSRMTDFLKNAEDEFGFRAERIKVVLHESKEKFWIYAGKDPKTKDDCTGFSYKSFFTLCPLTGILLLKSENQTLDDFNKQNYHFRAWKHDTLHYIQSQRCDQLGSPTQGMMEPWFLEGIAELSVIHTDKEHKAGTYESFFQKFLRKRTTLKEGNNPNLPDYRLVGTMFLEYLSLVYGNQKIRIFYEGTCFGKSSELSFQSEFGVSLQKATSDMYDYFQKNQSSFEKQFIEWRWSEKYKLKNKSRTVPEHCATSIQTIPKNPNEITEFHQIPCMMRKQVYDFNGLEGIYEGWFSGLSTDGKKESIFLWKSGAYEIKSEGQSWTIGEDEEQWNGNGILIVNWKGSGDRQIIFPNKKKVHCFYKSKTCSKPYE